LFVLIDIFKVTHKNILSIICGADQKIGDDESIDYNYIGYLPLAHILEMAAEVCFI